MPWYSVVLNDNYYISMYHVSPKYYEEYSDFTKVCPKNYFLCWMFWPDIFSGFTFNHWTITAFSCFLYYFLRQVQLHSAPFNVDYSTFSVELWCCQMFIASMASVMPSYLLPTHPAGGVTPVALERNTNTLIRRHRPVPLSPPSCSSTTLSHSFAFIYFCILSLLKGGRCFLMV